MVVGKDSFGKTVPQLADTEHFQRGMIYQFNRNFALARLHFLSIVERFPASVHLADSLYQLGRGFTLELNFNEAIVWFERYQSEFPEETLAKDALSQAASAYSKVNKPKEASSRYQKFIERYPDADNLERAYLNLVDLNRDTGDNGDALKWTNKTREVFKDKLPAALALFAQARIELSQKDWANALNDLTELQKAADLGGTRVPGGTNKNEVSFLRGYTLEQLGRIGEAADVYLSIADGRGEYYGWRSTERLKALAMSETGREIISEKAARNLETAQQNLTAQNADSIRIAAQNAYRLYSDPAILTKLLEVIRKTYSLLPAYQKIQT